MLKSISFSLVVLAVSSTLFVGCAGRMKVNGSDKMSFEACRGPKWYDDARIGCPKDSICVAGIGKSADTSFGRTKAEADARFRLASQISTEVAAILDEEQRQLAVSNEGYKTTVQTTNVIQERVGESIRGSMPIRYDQCGDSYYALLSYPHESMVRAIKAAAAKDLSSEQLVKFEADVRVRLQARMGFGE